MFDFLAWWENTERIGGEGAAGCAGLPKLILNWRIWFVLSAAVAEHVDNWN